MKYSIVRTFGHISMPGSVDIYIYLFKSEVVRGVGVGVLFTPFMTTLNVHNGTPLSSTYDDTQISIYTSFSTGAEDVFKSWVDTWHFVGLLVWCVTGMQGRLYLAFTSMIRQILYTVLTHWRTSIPTVKLVTQSMSSIVCTGPVSCGTTPVRVLTLTRTFYHHCLPCTLNSSLCTSSLYRPAEYVYGQSRNRALANIHYWLI